MVSSEMSEEQFKEAVYEACGGGGQFISNVENKRYRKPLQTRQRRNSTSEAVQNLSDTDSPNPEYYFASLFAKCDPNSLGIVKVSTLIAALRELQEMNEKDGSDYLDELERNLNPDNDDGELTLTEFTDRMKSYLGRLEEESENVENEAVDKEPTSRIAEDEPVMELGGKIQSELSSKVSDLKMQLQKVTEDNMMLRGRMNSVQEENCNVLQALDQKISQLRAQSDRIRRLEREMDDKLDIIHSLEGQNAALCNKFTKLGNEVSAFQRERKKLTAENAQFKNENEKLKNLVAHKDDMASKLKTENALLEMQWSNREKILNSKINDLTTSLNDLNQKIEELEYENSQVKQSKLEKSVVELPAISFAEEAALAGLDDNEHQSDQSQLSNELPQLKYNLGHFDNFLSNTEDIETEMAEAGEPQLFRVASTAAEKFDAATQCNYDNNNNAKITENEMDKYAVCNIVSTRADAASCEIAKQTIENSSTIIPLLIEEQKMISPHDQPLTINKPTIHRHHIVILFLVVVIFILLCMIPFEDACINPFMFRSVEHYFQYCGQLSHDQAPII